MSKSADYLISGVWKDTQKRITDVMLHSVNDGDTFNVGEKTAEAIAISLLKKGKTMRTVVWKYPNWNIKTNVIVVDANGKDYLRSEPNTSVEDNLDNLISMKALK